ncbi:helix-turn-helix transcriptional regulator [Vreelandella rituensis]|uniref:XRE family transcriptional regulator n=1 Tax=Vreelandella rituensis TaxID=2282306 RepID=A0A368UBC5_9GAMM|nr:helix-turn-helix transcriptional regulator [Halomonas rituensis]RCV93612.1 XRE family transcriptional regulator [Halomonas rituensis]
MTIKSRSPLGKRIVLIMTARGMSPKDLSRVSGIPPSTLSRVMACRSANPRLDTLERIASALGVPIAELFACEAADAENDKAEDKLKGEVDILMEEIHLGLSSGQLVKEDIALLRHVTRHNATSRCAPEQCQAAG